MGTSDEHPSVVTTTVKMSGLFEDPRYQIAAVTAFTVLFVLCCVCLVLCCVRSRRKYTPEQLYVSLGCMRPGISTFVANSHNAHYRLLEEYDGQRDEVEALLGQPDQAPESRRLFASPKEEKKERVPDSRRKIPENECHPRYETVPDYPQKDAAPNITYKI